MTVCGPVFRLPKCFKAKENHHSTSGEQGSQFINEENDLVCIHEFCSKIEFIKFFSCYPLKRIQNLSTELQTNASPDTTFIQDLRHSALTNSVSVHIRSRSTSPDRLFLLMLILSISCRTASAVLKYMQLLTHTHTKKNQSYNSRHAELFT